MDASSIILPAASGLIAGAMNALAGGGSFITLPALIALGLPSVVANASSTVALWPGSLASAWIYRDGLRPVANLRLQVMVEVTLAGGIIGGVLLLLTPTTLFDHMLPWLLAMATIVLAAGRRWGETLRRHSGVPGRLVLAIQALLGIYGGYFGGAVGIMMMAVWSLLDGADVKGHHAARTLLVSAANGGAILCFVVMGGVRWPEVLLVGVGAILGGVAGAWVGRRLPAPIVRATTLLLCAVITLAFFVHAYS